MLMVLKRKTVRTRMRKWIEWSSRVPVKAHNSTSSRTTVDILDDGLDPGHRRARIRARSSDQPTSRMFLVNGHISTIHDTTVSDRIATLGDSRADNDSSLGK